MKTNDDLYSELESIKKLLILNLISRGISHVAVAKASGMSTKTLYKFIPKNLSKFDKNTSGTSQ